MGQPCQTGLRAEAAAFKAAPEGEKPLVLIWEVFPCDGATAGQTGALPGRQALLGVGAKVGMLLHTCPPETVPLLGSWQGLPWAAC